VIVLSETSFLSPLFWSGQQAAANEALQTLLMQRPEIAQLSRQELAIWWQPDMVEHLIVGLRKAGLEG
jgi:hypothetical protein